MAYVLGIDIGGSHVTAAISRLWDNSWTQPEPSWLDTHSPTIAPVLHLAPNGALTPGDPTRTGTPRDTGRVARDFVARVGDPVPLLVGGEPWAAPALTAVLTGRVIEQVAAREGGHPEQVVLAHPAGWGGYRRGLVHAALWEIGLTNVTLLAEAVTAAESHVAAGFTGRTLAVLALHADGCTASVVGRARTGGFGVLDTTGEGEAYGGGELDLDEALREHVRTELGRQLGPRRLDDPRVRLALLGLPDECARARERLAITTETDVRLHLPDGAIRVPVSRAEFTELVRPAVRVAVDTLAAAVRGSGLPSDRLDGVLLVGGFARTPLVAELASARFPDLVTVGPDPDTDAAAGAAVAAGQIVLPTPRPEARPAGPRRAEPNPAEPAPARTTPAPSHHEPQWTYPEPLRGRQPLRDPVRAEPEPAPPPRPPIRITPLNLPKSRGTGLRGAGREPSAANRDPIDQRPGRSATRGHR
ncbi:Hsp70 family protein [Micromonospora sp. NBC_01699]|uniref:Hsp70 family protein n=1 Tax=Micromonospora sp. NBC_01699 TaxID=2975984 RepID=UPI002E29AD67|nr:Hsp70 family protein [Micromonospora sp. NBC_01699]